MAGVRSTIVCSAATSAAVGIKAHQVLRGKRDLALQGYWPGGPRPFGYKLVPSISVVNGNEVVLGSHLVPHPEEDWIVRLAFHRAKENGWGQDRTCRFLNDHQDIPQALKPFQSATVGRWLQNTIYKGHLSWNLHSTDIFCDARVIERNSPDEVLHIPDFCEPLVSKELWDEINELRAIRGEAISIGRRRLQGEEKLLKAPAPGLTLKYLLTGLVRCGHCGRAMVASSNKYTNRRGETVHYRSYCCPAYVGRNCDNSKRVPEEWLRETVVTQLRQRLLPGS